MALNKYDKMSKRELYDNNKEFFILIYLLGNKLAFQNQIRNLCLKLNLYDNKEEFNNEFIPAIKSRQMIDIVEGEYNTRTNLLLLKNPAIEWISIDLEKSSGRRFGKSKAKKNNTAIDTSLFKIQYAHKFLEEHLDINNAYDLLVELEKESNILYTQKKGLEYFNSFIVNNQEDLAILKSETKKQRAELTKASTDLKNSIPDKKGMTKEIIQEKRDKHEAETIEREEERKKNRDKAFSPQSDKRNDNNDYLSSGVSQGDIEYKNNFNSFLGRGCLLMLESTEQRTSKNQRVLSIDMNFKLYIFDIRSTLDAEKIGDKASKTYKMLKDFLCTEPKIRNKLICKTCSKNRYSQSFKREKKVSGYIPDNLLTEENFEKYYYRCDPLKKNSEYENCTDNTAVIVRNIYMEVIVLTWDEKRKKELFIDCNTEEKDAPFGVKPRTNLEKATVDKYIITDSIKDERFEFKFENFGLSDDVLGGKSRANIEKKNKKASVKKSVKENVIELATGGALTDKVAKELIDIMTANILNELKGD